MDPNGHINNVAYLAWALEVIPDDVCHDHQLKEVSSSSSIIIAAAVAVSLL
jgi:acyl-ACP thioesterase